MQSIYFCKTVGVTLNIYIPVSRQFLMYFNHRPIKIDLDSSYLESPFTALSNVQKLAVQEGITPRFFKMETFSASFIPIIPTNFDFMSCPRSTGNPSAKNGFGHIGSKFRKIVTSARFSLLVSRPGYKKWQSIAVFYTGSTSGANALKLGLRIGRASQLPVDVFTQAEGASVEFYKNRIESQNIEREMNRYVKQWHIFENGIFEDNLYKVPHDALVVIGSCNHGRVKDRIFGCKMEKIQSNLPNNLLIAGPRYEGPDISASA